MLSKYIQPGSRLEMQTVERVKCSDASEKKKVYESQVYEIISEDRLEIAMPMEKSKLVLLPVDVEYDLYFNTNEGLYQCLARIVDRYKNNAMYILLIELTGNLRKVQRREYYRFSCALEMGSRQLEEEEMESTEKRMWGFSSKLLLKRSVIVDISGGGLRFIANHAYDQDVLIYCKYRLIIYGKDKEYNLVGKVLKVRELENRPGIYEHRVQYIDIDTKEREEIIQFIFEEERKHRKKEKKHE